MKKAFTVFIAVILFVTAILSGCGSGNSSTDDKKSGGIVVESTGNDENADYTVSGKVVVAVDTARPMDYEAMFEALQNVYPNIDIEIDYFSHTTEDSAAEYLTARASTNNLPDVVFDEAGRLPLYISQGWVYPLDEFVADDPDIESVPASIIDSYRFGGKLYALPDAVTFQTIALNNDLLDELNLDHPETDWTFSDYEDLMKSATTAKYSGTDTLHGIEDWGAGILSTSATLCGYNYKTRTFEMTNSFANSLKLMRELRTKTAGLEGWSLSTTSNSSGKSDYEIKFGISYSSDTKHKPFYNGLTLSMLETGTWSRRSLSENCSFDWELWPVPQNEESLGRLPMHVDHSFMCSTSSNPDAAFQVLRYITYSTEGNIARLSVYDENNEGKYSLNSPYFIPATLNEKVAEKFESLPDVDEAAIYMYKNIPNSFRADPKKIVPGWTNVDETVIRPSANTVADGKADAMAVCSELQGKATAAIKEYWDDFDKKLADVQKTFDAS